MEISVSGFGTAALAVALLDIAVVAGVAEAPVRPASVSLVQAVPGRAVDVRVDERRIGAADPGDVLGPISLTPGSHVVTFDDRSARAYSAVVHVPSGASADVVLHPPAGPDNRPVVTAFRTPRRAIGPGKARLLVAMTATVVPADFRVDGQALATNVANGEFATVDVPAGRHQLTVAPTGLTGSPLLGPVELVTPARTVSMVYVVGRAATGPTDLIVHRRRLRNDGGAPEAVHTGSVGLVDPTRPGRAQP